ncbi:DUF222 domain-containing protein [Actinomadura sp. DLS-62]|uniref:DUF222 domain-containing protein n=1 Tax=Actinomadura monticuli TaxID=3097367 RepID=A0ABV4Q7T5_9ACTN
MSVPAEIVGRQREWADREWFPPGPQLAICLSGGKERLADLTDDELLQVAAAARRQTSWAQARELAAIAELTQRRTQAEADGDPDYRILSARESVTEEVAAALTITSNASATLLHLAESLTGPLAATGAALEAGRVDLAKARVISDLTESLPRQVTQRVQTAALEKASTQTTGQLRRRIRRIVQRLAPEAIEERKQQAVRQRRLELWDTPSGTADLSPCDLAAEVFTQLCSVYWLIPRSRATCATGRPVSCTMRTAPARNSGSNERLSVSNDPTFSQVRSPRSQGKRSTRARTGRSCPRS